MQNIKHILTQIEQKKTSKYSMPAKQAAGHEAFLSQIAILNFIDWLKTEVCYGE